jgi:hypothetical protein
MSFIVNPSEAEAEFLAGPRPPGRDSGRVDNFERSEASECGEVSQNGPE